MGDLESGEDGISLISLGRDGEWEDYKTKMSWTMHPEKTRLRPTGITISFIRSLGPSPRRRAAWESGEDGISLISLGRDPSPRRKRPGR